MKFGWVLTWLLVLAAPAFAQGEAPAAPAAKPLVLQDWAVSGYAGLWRFNVEEGGGQTYGVLRLNPDGTSFEQMGGRMPDGTMFDGAPMTGRWSASVNVFEDGGFLITVTQDGENGGNDVYQIYDDGTLRRGETVWQRIEP